MGMYQFRVVGKKETTAEPINKVVNISGDKFEKKYDLKPTQENMRRQIVSDFLKKGVIVSEIQTPTATG